VLPSERAADDSNCPRWFYEMDDSASEIDLTHSTS